MVTCGVCAHPNIKAIDAALDTGRHQNIVRAQFHLNPEAFAVHIAHRSAPLKGLRESGHLSDTRNHLPGQSLRVSGVVGQGAALTDDPMRRARYHASQLAAAWAEVDEEWRTLARLERLLKDAFEDEGLGL